jgi:5-methylcytosine-specific restriction endonuclease McrA
MDEELFCPLCKRKVLELTDHHIVPKSRGGTELVGICKDCHRQVHALFDNKQLEEELNTVDALLSNDQFAKFIKWVSKKPFGVVHKAKRSKDTKKRGRRG